MASSTQDDLEMDADQSNPGTGSFKFLQAEETEKINPAIAQSGVSFESLLANLQVLQQQTNESKAELIQKLKVALEEKDIWMTRCQRMESQISEAKEDDNSADKTVDDLKYLKAENEMSTQEAVAGKDEGDVVCQPQVDNSTANQHDMTLAGSKDSPDGGGPIKDQAPQSTKLRRRICSLRERRGIEPQRLNDPRCVTGHAGEGAFDTEAVNPEDIGDKPPSIEMFQYLSMNLQHADYRPVLRNANLDDKVFGDIEYQHHGNAKECRFQAFTAWQMDKGHEATVRKLVHAILVTKLRNVAEKFCQQFGVYFLVDEYDKLHPDVDDEPDTPFLGDSEQPDDQVEPPQKGPLEKLLGPLMLNPENYEEEFVPLLDGVVDFTDEQVQTFVKEQKWKNESKILFNQELQAVLNNKLTVLNVLTCWSLTIHNIYDCKQHCGVVEKRKHIWKMMKSLRKSHETIFARLKRNRMFQGGVLGLNPLIEKEMLNRLNFSLHIKMRSLLQQRRDDGKDWRGVASKIPHVDSQTIANWQQKGDDKATEDTLKTFGTCGNGTVQKLYEVLVDLDRGDVARVLED